MVIPELVATTTVVGEIAKQAQDFIAAASGHPGETVGTILGNITRRRLDNLMPIMNQANLILLNIGEKPGEIPLNILQPTLEAASLAEDAEMQERWANLLANAANPRRETKVHPAFVRILGEFAPEDALFLDKFYDLAMKSHPSYEGSGVDLWRLWNETNQNSLDLLLLNQLLTRGESYLPDSGDGSNKTGKERYTLSGGEYELTALGASFVLACRAPQPASEQQPPSGS